MIQVPSFWSCARYPCAVMSMTSLVSGSGGSSSAAPQDSTPTQTALCRVIPETSGARRHYTVQPWVRLPDPRMVERLTGQDCSPPEVHLVLVCTEESRRVAGGYLYSVAQEPLGVAPTPPLPSGYALVRLTIRCPKVLYAVKTVTLTGPRSHVRLSPAHWAAALMGCYVVVGAEMRQGSSATCRVTQLESKPAPGQSAAGGRTGIMLVGALSKVRLNDSWTPLHPTSTVPHSATTLGLEHPVQQLMAFLRRAAEWPSSSPKRLWRRGVVVRGPHSCGVSTTVQTAFARCATPLVLQVVRWRPGALSVTQVLEHVVPRARLLVLQLDAGECFPLADPELSQRTLRALESDVCRLLVEAESESLRVAVVAVGHRYGSQCAASVMEGFFTEHVVLSMPDAETRALLLAAAAGSRTESTALGWDGVPEDERNVWRRRALELVGRTRKEVREAAAHWRAAGDGSTIGHARPKAATALPKVPWDAIGGLEAVKRELQQALVLPHRHRDAFQKFHLTAPNGVLLYGPPGCAKTTLVKALCAEGIFSLLYLDSASVMSAYVGESERLLRDAFQQAAQQAPCIVFFDEVEVLGGAREPGGGGGKEARLLSTVLTEMDGFTSSAAGRGVCFVGATNVPHLLDSALLRPGRLDRLLYVPLPSETDRADILSLFLNGTAADIPDLAHRTEGFSGADLKSLCTVSLLELLTAEKRGTPRKEPEVLGDSAYLETFFRDKVRTFPRTPYNHNAIREFHQTTTQARSA